MSKLARALDDLGYLIVNEGYSSFVTAIEELADAVVARDVASCRAQGAKTIHFVSHSLGGILVRTYLARHDLKELGRVVMLSPPNQGSEIADELGEIPWLSAWLGPASRQLGTGADDLPRRLGPVDYPVGVIMGNRSVNPFFSWIIPGEDDGTVSVASARLRGMTDFLLVSHSHTFIMFANDVAEQVAHFLRYGRFDSPVEADSSENATAF